MGDKDMIVKINCTYTAFIIKMTVDEVILRKIVLFWKKNGSGSDN